MIELMIYKAFDEYEAKYAVKPNALVMNEGSYRKLNYESGIYSKETIPGMIGQFLRMSITIIPGYEDDEWFMLGTQADKSPSQPRYDFKREIIGEWITSEDE